jgi:Na+/H+-dicarboxylate symporter
VQTKYKKVDERIYFVNKSITDVMRDPTNMSSFLSSNMIDPWSVSSMKDDEEVKVIKTETTYIFDGVESSSKMNVLGIVCFSVAFGAILSRMGEVGRPMTAFFSILLEVIMKLVTLIIW